MRLYDTSAVLDHLRGGKTVEGYVLDLTHYEIANALRTAVQVKKYMSRDDARAIIHAFKEQLIRTIRIDIEDVDGIEKLAEELNIRAYDAAYIYFAERYGLELITADRRLEKAWKSRRTGGH